MSRGQKLVGLALQQLNIIADQSNENNTIIINSNEIPLYDIIFDDKVDAGNDSNVFIQDSSQNGIFEQTFDILYCESDDTVADKQKLENANLDEILENKTTDDDLSQQHYSVVENKTLMSLNGIDESKVDKIYGNGHEQLDDVSQQFYTVVESKTLMNQEETENEILMSNNECYLQEINEINEIGESHINDPNYTPEDNCVSSSESEIEDDVNIEGKSDNLEAAIENNGSLEGNNNDEADKEQKTRKRKRNEAQWKRNVIKQKRNKGEGYINWNNKSVSKRELKPVCMNCRLKCSTKFSDEERKNIFTTYWELADVNRQRDFILKYVDIKDIKRSRIRNTKTKTNIPCEIAISDKDITENVEDEDSSRRKYSYFYHLPQENERTKVCQTFFLSTLSISHQVVKTCAKKRKRSGNTAIKDMRGVGQCNTRLANAVLLSVKEHIRSFDTVESHYIRKRSTRNYLPANLNITKMYQLYKEYCTQKKITSIVKESMYRHIFNTEFNLSFFKPKKDRCDLCEKYNNGTEEEKTEMKTVMETHMRNKVRAREQKEADKKRAKEDDSFTVAVFDLQQVLSCPHVEISQLYYKRKLSTYNLTVFQLNDNIGYCYMWPESQGNRGSIEISTCVMEFIKTKANEEKKEISFYSDNCGGQNRNRNIVCMYIYCSKKYDMKITHSFLEKGHTQNEGDCVHSVIEKASKNVPIYIPAQWYTIARTACRKKPYIVKEMSIFYDFELLKNETTNNLNKDIDNNKIKWQNIRQILIDPTESDIVCVKYDYEEDFHKIKITGSTRKQLQSMDDHNLKTAYNSSIPITTQKYKDLVSLCNERVIPHEYQDFFKNLKHSNNAKRSADEN